MSENQKDTQNGVTRPKPGTKTNRVWEIVDTLSAEIGAPAPRKKVLEAAMAEGINVATAATQYGRWRKYHGLGDEPKEAAEGGEGSDVSTEVDAE